MRIPTHTEIKALRKSAGLSLAQAAALIHVTASAWTKWEAPPESPSSRNMEAAKWELFCQRVAERYAKFNTPFEQDAFYRRMLMKGNGTKGGWQYLAQKYGLLTDHLKLEQAAHRICKPSERPGYKDWLTQDRIRNLKLVRIANMPNVKDGEYYMLPWAYNSDQFIESFVVPDPADIPDLDFGDSEDLPDLDFDLGDSAPSEPELRLEDLL